MTLTHEQKQLIAQRCKPFLQELENYDHLLLCVLPILDVDSNNIAIIKGYEYDNSRIPSYLKDAFNDIFEKYYGYPYCKGIHCYFVDQPIPQNHKQYIVFPVGDFNYCWSPDITSIFDYYVSHTSETRIDYEYTYSEVIGYVDNEVRYKYVNNQIIDAIDTFNEIMVYCDEYIAIPFDSLP